MVKYSQFTCHFFRHALYYCVHCNTLLVYTYVLILSLPVTLFIRGTGIDLSTSFLSFLSSRVSPLILSHCMAFRVVAESVHVLVYHLSVSLLLISFPSFCLHDLSHFTHGFSVSLSLAIITQAAGRAGPECEIGTWVALVNTEVIHEQM